MERSGLLRNSSGSRGRGTQAGGLRAPSLPQVTETVVQITEAATTAVPAENQDALRGSLRRRPAVCSFTSPTGKFYLKQKKALYVEQNVCVTYHPCLSVPLTAS